MAITTMAGLSSAFAVGPRIQFYGASSSGGAVGAFICANQGSTSFGTIATPTTYSSGGSTYTNSAVTAGLPFWTPGSANTYVAGAEIMNSNNLGALYLYDVLWACSGMSGTVTTAQTVSSFSGMPTRNSTGAGAELWAWGFTTIGATATTLTVSYTNSAGSTGHTSSAVTVSALNTKQMINIPLQSADLGIESVASATLSASSGTSGNFGLAIMQRVCVMPVTALNTLMAYDFADLGLPQISDSASLLFVYHSTSTTSGALYGVITLAQG